MNLAALHTEKTPGEIKYVDFPIRGTALLKQAELTRFRRHFTETMGPDVAERLEQLQVASLGDQKIWGTHIHPLVPANQFLRAPSGVPIALRALGQLDNRDKHRAIHSVWSSLDWAGSKDLSLPEQVERAGGSYFTGPLRNGMTIASIRVKATVLPDLSVSDVTLREAYPLDVMIAEEALSLDLGDGGSLDRKPLAETLGFFLWAVAFVLQVFKPTLVHGDAPAPLVPDVWRRS